MEAQPEQEFRVVSPDASVVKKLESTGKGKPLAVGTLLYVSEVKIVTSGKVRGVTRVRHDKGWSTLQLKGGPVLIERLAAYRPSSDAAAPGPVSASPEQPPAAAAAGGADEHDREVFLEADSFAWLPHETEIFIPCKVLRGGSGEVELEAVDGGELHTTTADAVLHMHPSCLVSTPDMVLLGDLNEASILHNLRARYRADEIYTYIGPILVSCNPYKYDIDVPSCGGLNIYAGELIDLYFKQRNAGLRGAAGGMPPHAFEVAGSSFGAIERSGKNQSMVISGESGAGKTEATKLAIRFLAQVAAAPADETAASARPGPQQLLLESSPIMEAFGNAKTVRNNNSSRFGKYMEVEFSPRHTIMSGKIAIYLLEKSRIVRQAPGERNFHAFYLAFQLPAAERSRLQLCAPADYAYLMRSAAVADGIDDGAEFGDVRSAFRTLDVSAEEESQLWRLVSAVLQLGNVSFAAAADGEDGAGCRVADLSPLTVAAELLGVECGALAQTLTTREMTVMRETTTVPLSVTQAENARDATAKHLYGRLFSWITSVMNRALACTADAVSSIGLLDIFGFESFAVNSFEQLCINYANEKLQYHFNDHVFTLELATYKAEGLKVDEIKFVDNSVCLQLIEEGKTKKDPKIGILGMIDDEIHVPRGSNKSLLEKLHNAHAAAPGGGRGPKKGKGAKDDGANPFYERPKMSAKSRRNLGTGFELGGFIVKHYAGPVEYQVDGFLEKNKDTLMSDVQALLRSSSMGLLTELFDAEGEFTPKAKSGRAPTLGGQFKSSLQLLYAKLEATSPHFIKCVKPNNVKENVFNSAFSLYQLQYLGLLEVVRIRQSGYPVRMSMPEFMQRYWVLDEAAASPSAVCVTSDDVGGRWQQGKTMLFMKDELFAAFEGKRGRIVQQKMKQLQQVARTELLPHNRWLERKRGCVCLQAAARGAHGRWMAKLRRRELAAECIQSYSRMLAPWRRFAQQRRAAIHIESCARRRAARVFVRRGQAQRRIAAVQRRNSRRRAYVILKAGALVVQRLNRGRRGRARAAREKKFDAYVVMSQKVSRGWIVRKRMRKQLEQIAEARKQAKRGLLAGARTLSDIAKSSKPSSSRPRAARAGSNAAPPVETHADGRRKIPIVSTPKKAARPAAAKPEGDAWRAVKKGVVRSGIGAHSVKRGQLSAGEEILVLEQRPNESGQLRVRFEWEGATGWASVTATKTGNVLLEPAAASEPDGGADDAQKQQLRDDSSGLLAGARSIRTPLKAPPSAAKMRVDVRSYNSALERRTAILLGKEPWDAGSGSGALSPEVTPPGTPRTSADASLSQTHWVHAKLLPTLERGFAALQRERPAPADALGCLGRAGLPGQPPPSAKSAAESAAEVFEFLVSKAMLEALRPAVAQAISARPGNVSKFLRDADIE